MGQARRPTSISMTEKEDIEAHLGAVNDTQNETITDKSLGILSRMRSANWKDPGPPPDGGALAWAQVLAGHLIVLNTW